MEVLCNQLPTDHLRAHKLLTQDWLVSVTWPVKLPLAFTSTLIPGFSLLKIHDQDFYSLLDMYMFRNGASRSTKEDLAFLRRCHVCCTIVSARVYPRRHSVQINMDTVHLLTLHYSIYARNTEVFCQCMLVQRVVLCNYSETPISRMNGRRPVHSCSLGLHCMASGWTQYKTLSPAVLLLLHAYLLLQTHVNWSLHNNGQFVLVPLFRPFSYHVKLSIY
jgi:hypothetical protein